MKNIFKSLCAVAALGLFVAGCSIEGNGNNDNTKTEEKANISFVIKTPTPATRAADKGQGAATQKELNVNAATGMKFVVFSTSGIVEARGFRTLAPIANESGKYETPLDDPQVIPAGQHWFFVFLNDPETGGKIALPTVGQSFAAWIAEKPFNVTFDSNNNPLIADMTGDGNFLLGTMWKEDVTAPAGNTEDNPGVITLTVGRLASKILLKEVKKGDGANKMQGTYTDAKWRLGTIAKRMNPAGNMKDADVYNPYTTGKVVISAVHTAPFVSGDAFNTTDFLQYTGGTDATPANFGTFEGQEVNATNVFYATENTTSRQSDGDKYTSNLFYGNTTYIQVETVYNPTIGDGGEVHGIDPADNTKVAEPAAGVTLTDKNFWTANVPGDADPVIFNANPSSIANVSNIKEYKGGKNYHKFAIQDEKETADAVAKFRVLRNHYYEFVVTNIDNLGDNTPIVDPKDPVEEDTFIRFNASVVPWDKVSSNIGL